MRRPKPRAKRASGWLGYMSRASTHSPGGFQSDGRGMLSYGSIDMYTRKGFCAKSAPIRRVEVPRTVSALREITYQVPLVEGYQIVTCRTADPSPDSYRRSPKAPVGS